MALRVPQAPSIIVVNNVAPTISVDVTSPINENDFATLQLAIVDPGSLDSHDVYIDWGDGIIEPVINLPAGSGGAGADGQPSVSG